MRIALLLAALALGGCQSAEQLRALAPQQTDFEICRAMVMGQGPVVGVAREEAGRRNLNCSPHLATIQAMQIQQAQQTNTGLQLLQMAQPQPMPIPMPSQSVICTSRPGPSGTATTVCQ